jgi:hypothetical protein
MTGIEVLFSILPFSMLFSMLPLFFSRCSRSFNFRCSRIRCYRLLSNFRAELAILVLKITRLKQTKMFGPELFVITEFDCILILSNYFQIWKLIGNLVITYDNLNGNFTYLIFLPIYFLVIQENWHIFCLLKKECLFKRLCLIACIQNIIGVTCTS